MADLYSPYTYYFSGAQTSIFINNIMLDEVQGIAFNVQSNIVPRYHYTDTEPRRLAVGRKLVTGELALNYIHPMYLLLYLKDNDKMSDYKSSYLKHNLSAIPTLESDNTDMMRRQAAYNARVEADNDPESEGMMLPSLDNPITTAPGDNGGPPTPFFTGLVPFTGEGVSNPEEFYQPDVPAPSALNIQDPTNISNEDIRALEQRYWDDSKNGGNNPSATANITIDKMMPVDLIIKIGEPGMRHIHVLKQARFSGPQVRLTPSGEPLTEVYTFVACNFV